MAVAFSPDEMAGLMPPLTLPGTPSPQSVAIEAPPLDERHSEFLRRLSNSGRRMANTPTVFGTPAIPGIAPPGRDPTSFQRQGVEQLSTASAPDVPVEQAAPLSREQAFRNAVTGGGSGGLGQLRGDWQNARKGVLAGYDDQRALEGRKGVAQADKTEAVAEMNRVEAAKKIRDAEIQQQQDAATASEHQRFMTRNVELADDIAKQQIDPRRLVKNRNAGQRIGDILGSALGGFAGGLRGGGNDFVDRFDKQVSQEIESQVNAIDNKKASLSARNSVFGQMLQETGDRRLAALQTRNLMYEAGKQKVDADAQALGIPEVLVNADIAKAAIQEKQDKLNEQYTHESYATAQAQAAAAANAERAREQKAWDRKMEVAKLGLEQDKLKIEAGKAQGQAGKEDNEAIQNAAKLMSDDDIVKNRALINGLNQRIDDNTGEVKGLGFGARALSAISNSGPGSLALPARALVNDQDRITQQDWERARLLYQTQVTGSGGSDEQMKQISAAFKGAGTMAEKAHAIKLLKAELDTREGRAQSGLSDAQKALFQQRLLREGQADMPGDAKKK